MKITVDPCSENQFIGPQLELEALQDGRIRITLGNASDAFHPIELMGAVDAVTQEARRQVDEWRRSQPPEALVLPPGLLDEI